MEYSRSAGSRYFSPSAKRIVLQAKTCKYVSFSSESEVVESVLDDQRP
jgi:hypothetical protein